MNHNLSEQKQSLVEKLGIFIENKDQLAPIAARILSYIILTGQGGTTFEDLVTHLCASKSTISTHLNHLQNLNKIVYFTKPGDRKKYFIINKEIIIQNIDDMICSWSNQKDLHTEIKSYKESMNSLKGEQNTLKFDLEFHDNYIKFLNEATKSILELRAQIIINHNNL